MPSGQELVDWAVARRGIGYSWEGRFGPNAYDCSGLVTADCWDHGLQPTGWNSTGLELWCRDNGLGVDVGVAIGVPGALVFIWGYGANGHVAMSTGDGRVIETPSDEGHMVGFSGFWTGRTHAFWTGAALIPGVDTGAVTPSDPILRVGSNGPVVADWQKFLGVTADGQFGPQTEQAVKNFQSLFGLEIDGIIGKQTWETRRYIENVQTPSPTPAPAPPESPQEDLMYIAVGDAVMGRIACCVDGGYRIGEMFTAPVGGYGIPQDAIDWNGQPGRGLRYVFFDGDNDRFAKLLDERP